MTEGSSPNPGSGASQRLGPLADALLDATLPACVRDAAGRYVAVNPSFADLVGLEAARLVGKTDNALQPADVAHRVAELDALVLEAHGHLDARETVLARDGRRALRAWRPPRPRGAPPAPRRPPPRAPLPLPGLRRRRAVGDLRRHGARRRHR